MFRSLLLAVALASAALSIPETALAGQIAQTSKAAIQADLGYLLYTPSDYDTSGRTYPLVVWLHGGDQGGSDIEKVRRSGLPKLIEGGKEFPSSSSRRRTPAKNCFIRSRRSTPRSRRSSPAAASTAAGST